MNHKKPSGTTIFSVTECQKVIVECYGSLLSRVHACFCTRHCLILCLGKAEWRKATRIVVDSFVIMCMLNRECDNATMWKNEFRAMVIDQHSMRIDNLLIWPS